MDRENKHHRVIRKENQPSSAEKSSHTHTESGASSHSHSSEVCPNHTYRIEPRLIDYIGYGIYLGSFGACCKAFLKANKISHVLSIAHKSRDFNYGSESVSGNLSTSFSVSFVDMEDRGLPDDADLTAILKKLASTIHAYTEGDGTVFVHCQVGFSRSPLAVITFLHEYKDFTWHEAFLWVGRRRPQMELKPDFKKYLERQATAEGTGDDFKGKFDLPGDREAYPVKRNKPYLDGLDMKFTNVQKDIRPERKIIYCTEDVKQIQSSSPPPGWDGHPVPFLG